jgi:hypothetical protein
MMLEGEAAKANRKGNTQLKASKHRKLAERML